MQGGTRQIGFTTVGSNVSVTIIVVRVADDPANPNGTSRRPIVRVANSGTGTAMGGVGSQVDFAAVRISAVAILISRAATRDNTGATRATSDCVIERTYVAARAAIGRIIGHMRLTTVRGNTVAVLVARLAVSDRTCAACATCRGMAKRARGTALATVRDVIGDVDFATVSGIPVAVGVASVTSTDGADTAATRCGRVGKRAYIAASATVFGVGVQIGLTQGTSVTIAFGCRFDT